MQHIIIVNTPIPTVYVNIQGNDIKTDEDFAKFIKRYYLEFYDFDA